MADISSPQTPTGAGPPPGPAVPDGAPRHEGRGWIALPILALVLLVAGIGLAIVGLTARRSAEADLVAARDQLPAATAAQQKALKERDAAEADRRAKSDEQAAAAKEAQRVAGIANDAATIADDLCDCNQKMANAQKEMDAADIARDEARFNAARDQMQAEIAKANDALRRYDKAIADLDSTS